MTATGARARRPDRPAPRPGHRGDGGRAASRSTRLEFGTAGLRGGLGAGPNRMNRVLVGAGRRRPRRLSCSARATARVSSSATTAAPTREVFATDTAVIMAGAGVRAILLPRLLPTPVLAFAVRHLQASAGVMVTASHNPPQDNGYKVYLGGDDGGSQIVPPVDAEIAADLRGGRRRRARHARGRPTSRWRARRCSTSTSPPRRRSRTPRPAARRSSTPPCTVSDGRRPAGCSPRPDSAPR